MAPSRILIQDNQLGRNSLVGQCRKCNKCGENPKGHKRANGLNNCKVLEEGSVFYSKSTGELCYMNYARLHEAYIKDTKSFLRHLEELNDTRAPFKERTKLLSWDIKNYYPNYSTELCMQAVSRILDERGTNLPQNSKSCILEALSITMSSYNG